MGCQQCYADKWVGECPHESKRPFSTVFPPYHWTDQKPDREGWWFHRKYKDAAPYLRWVYMDRFSFQGFPRLVTVLYSPQCAGGIVERIDRMRGQWSSAPIPLPGKQG